MFVQTNSIQSIREYFKNKLSSSFSDNEIKLIGNEVISLRLGLTKSDLIGSDEKLLSESDLLYFRSIVKRLMNNEPFQYIVGNAHFYGLELKSDKRALIPRPETEELVDWVKTTFAQSDAELRIADICTGSGCIALALKSLFQNSTIIASDISNEALDLVRENCEVTGLNVELKNIDALDEVGYVNDFEFNTFDCWVSNPPYIPEEEKSKMAENVLEFEPHLALFVPNDNVLIFYKSISRLAAKYLKSGGFLFFEIHEDLSSEVVLLLAEFEFVEIEVKKDLQGRNRMVKAVKK